MIRDELTIKVILEALPSLLTDTFSGNSYGLEKTEIIIQVRPFHYVKEENKRPDLQFSKKKHFFPLTKQL